MSDVLNKMQQLTWGVEIECVGLTRAECARVVATATAGTASTYGDRVTLSDGRNWEIQRDGSLSGGDRSAEVVTPVMKWADMEMFQNVLRALREAGARVDSSCGQHVHVGVKPNTGNERDNVRAVQSVLRTAYRYEEVVIKACAIQESRLGHYCKRTEERRVEKLSRAKDTASLNRAWYGRRSETYATKMDGTRYTGINLNSWFFRGTVEFRWFEGTMHAGEAKANVLMALALTAYGMTGTSMRPMYRAGATNRDAVTATKEWMNYFLTRCAGLTGSEFESVREHLTKRLPEV